MNAKLTAEYLRARVSYDPISGIFVWKARTEFMFSNGARSAANECAIWNAKHAGITAGHLNKGSGYIVIPINGHLCQAHRLAWLYVHGEIFGYIDHINLDRADNRIANLRIATPAENNANSPKRRGTSSPFKGVTWHKQCQKWQAAIKVAGKNRHLGLFSTEMAAHAAYCDAAKDAYGQFMRSA